MNDSLITTFHHVAFPVKDMCLSPLKSCALPCGSAADLIDNWRLLGHYRGAAAENSECGFVDAVCRVVSSALHFRSVVMNPIFTGTVV